ncbi:MAG TPA: hypothetical protein DD490_03800, partial [Acidobacteria bacterium]|nr:hypothetical protein [Acidobacteriota bacterium]
MDVRLFALFALPLAILAQWGFLELLRYPPRPWYFLPVLAVVAFGLDLRLAGSPHGRGVRLAAAVLA